MSGWTGFALQTPPGLNDVGSGMATAAQTLRGSIEVLRAQAQLAVAAAEDPSTPSVAAAAAALRAGVEAVTRLLESLLDDVGLHVLLVPLPKKGVLRLLEATPGDETGTTEVRFPAARLPEEARRSAVFDQIADPAALYLGGNAHFVKTVAESLFDANDPNRPRFQRDDRWAYVAMLAGAEDLGAALTLATALERVFGARRELPATRGALAVVPSGVTGRLSTRGQRAVLEWSPPPVSRVIEGLARATIVATHYAVIRATDWRVRTALRVADLFASNELRVGMTGRYGARVVAVEEYNGVAAQWTDPEPIPAGESRFYTVAFRTRYEPQPGDNAEQPADFHYGELAAAVEIRRETRGAAQSPTRAGRPPNWHRTPSPAALFPAVEVFLDRAIEQVRGLTAATQSFASRNELFLQHLEREITRFDDRLREFEHHAAQVAGLLEASRALAGAYTRVAAGQGPAASFLADLMRSMDPGTDPGTDVLPGTTPLYPPFVLGSEYVCGVVVLAVGPDTREIEAAFRALFGGAAVGSEAEQARAGIAAVEQLVAAADAAVLAAIPGAEREGGGTGIAADGTVRADGSDATCDPVESATPEFDDALRSTT